MECGHTYYEMCRYLVCCVGVLGMLFGSTGRVVWEYWVCCVGVLGMLCGSTGYVVWEYWVWSMRVLGKVYVNTEYGLEEYGYDVCEYSVRSMGVPSTDFQAITYRVLGVEYRSIGDTHTHTHRHTDTQTHRHTHTHTDTILHNNPDFSLPFSEEVRTANIIADDKDGVDCLCLDRE